MQPYIQFNFAVRHERPVRPHGGWGTRSEMKLEGGEAGLPTVFPRVAPARPNEGVVDWLLAWADLARIRRATRLVGAVCAFEHLANLRGNRDVVGLCEKRQTHVEAPNAAGSADR